MNSLDWRDLVYDPDVRTHYGPASNARMAALHERLKAMLAKTKVENEAAPQAAVERRMKHKLPTFADGTPVPSDETPLLAGGTTR